MVLFVSLMIFCGKNTLNSKETRQTYSLFITILENEILLAKIIQATPPVPPVQIFKKNVSYIQFDANTCVMSTVKRTRGITSDVFYFAYIIVGVTSLKSHDINAILLTLQDAQDFILRNEYYYFVIAKNL